MTADVTFIMPVFNGAPYLAEAIESVLAQTRRDWKLLVVDDGSTDGSAAALGRYTDPRIRSAANARNLGLYATLARWVAQADTRWVALLMQDDRLKREYLEEMLGLVRRWPSARGFWAAHDCVGASGLTVRSAAGALKEELIDPGEAPWLSVMRRGTIWTISGSLTERKLLEEIPFDGRYPHGGDYDWFLKAIRRAPFVYYHKALVDIRLHEGQASTENLRTGRDVAEYYEILRSNFAEHAAEIPRAEALRIAWARALPVLRRSAKALATGRFAHAGRLLDDARRFLALAGGAK